MHTTNCCSWSRALWVQEAICASAFTHIKGDEGLALQEAGQNLLLDFGQVIFEQHLLATLHGVLAVGQHQGNEVSFQLVVDHVQVGQICRADMIAMPQVREKSERSGQLPLSSDLTLENQVPLRYRPLLLSLLHVH